MLSLLSAVAIGLQGDHNLRPPAVPLVTHDPYFSIWSKADHAYDDVTRHWTGMPNAITIQATIDGKPYQVMGKATPGEGNSDALAPINQTSERVLPTRSIYTFESAGADLTLTFTSPLLPNDLEVFARPATYVTWAFASTDGKSHRYGIRFRADSQIATGRRPKTGEVATAAITRHEVDGLSIERIANRDQHVLSSPGDGTVINWGDLYVSAPDRNEISDGASPFPYRWASSGGTGTGHLTLAYDELYEVSYFGHQLLPYWKRTGLSAERMLVNAEHDYSRVMRECEKFDHDLMADMEKEGGRKYAEIAALSYRQSLAATGLAADPAGQPLLFTKENTSNGDIATVDVIFPGDPLLLLLSPALAKASLVPDLDYATSPYWKFPNAPHDLGTYPIANGTDDGGEGMPVEESGNMLILCDAIVQEENSPQFVSKWWSKLTQWETYLEKYGYDPEDQLCTDDFMGHLAHNANLSIKAILGIAAYGDMCQRRGDHEAAQRIRGLAQKYAAHWMEVGNSPGHSLLAFDKPGTWSQKYNLVWDQILGLHVFPPSLAAEEVAWYKTQLQPFGLPLDSRTKLTKTDWTLWSATLAQHKSDFEDLISPLWTYLDTTTNHQPLVDSYITTRLGSDGMHARSVVGGIFIKMLSDRPMWMKWAKRGDQKVGPWAPFRLRPTSTDVVPVAQRWAYTSVTPPKGWTEHKFDDARWQRGNAPFGSLGTPGILPATAWTSDDIWLRRTVVLPNHPFHHLEYKVFHDEDVQIYVGGVLTASEPNYITSYKYLDILPATRSLFLPGATITICVHCHQTTGGQGIDVGLVDVAD
jgi:hypothetical protein